MVVRHHEELKQKEERARREEQAKLRRIATSIAKEVRQFWSNVEKVVQFKQQSRLEAKRKKALDLQLDFIVGQTEKYSDLLSQSLNETVPLSKTSSSCVGSSQGGSLRTSPTPSVCQKDGDFFPHENEEDDDEETIEMEERQDGNDAESHRLELELLKRESELPLDELLQSLPPEILQEEVDIEDAESDDSSEGEQVEEEDDEFTANEEEAEDEEETIAAQEELEGQQDHTEELSQLAQEGEMSIEDLLKKYSLARTDKETVEQSGSSLLSEQEASESSECDSSDCESEGVEFLVKQEDEDAGAEHSQQEPPEPKKEITDIAATAESLQPKGYTLATTQVKTPVPFLLRGDLREYQHIGLEWLVTMYEKKLNGILADEMGLGKTIQTISLLAHLACDRGNWGPHLIIVPTSVILNWEMELKRWCPSFKILTYYGSQKERKLKRQGWTKANAFHVCITSYKLVLQDHQAFRRKNWRYLILDEAQNIKNFKSQRWQSLLNFNSQRRLLLTGTPLQNSLMELWSLMHFLMPHVFQSHREFKEWFSNPLTGMIEGSQEYNEGLVRRLHKVLRPFLLRRIKLDVEKQMPKKYEHVIYCRLSKRQRFLYDDFMSQAATRESLASGHFMSVINILMQLRKVCNHPNLFDPRPIHSPFITTGICYSIPSLVLHALQRHPLEYVDTSLFDLINVEGRVSRYESDVFLDRHKPSRQLIQEIADSPEPPPRPRPLKMKVNRMLQPVVKPESRSVVVVNSARPVQKLPETPTTSSSSPPPSAPIPPPPPNPPLPSTAVISGVAQPTPQVSPLVQPPPVAMAAPPVSSELGKPVPLQNSQPLYSGPQRFILTPDMQARLPSGEVISLSQLASLSGRCLQSPSATKPLTLQLQGTKLTLSGAQVRPVGVSQPRPMQGNVLHLVSSGGQHHLLSQPAQLALIQALAQQAASPAPAAPAQLVQNSSPTQIGVQTLSVQGLQHPLMNNANLVAPPGPAMAPPGQVVSTPGVVKIVVRQAPREVQPSPQRPPLAPQVRPVLRVLPSPHTEQMNARDGSLERAASVVATSNLSLASSPLLMVSSPTVTPRLPSPSPIAPAPEDASAPSLSGVALRFVAAGSSPAVQLTNHHSSPLTHTASSALTNCSVCPALNSAPSNCVTPQATIVTADPSVLIKSSQNVDSDGHPLQNGNGLPSQVADSLPSAAPVTCGVSSSTSNIPKLSPPTYNLSLVPTLIANSSSPNTARFLASPLSLLALSPLSSTNSGPGPVLYTPPNAAAFPTLAAPLPPASVSASLPLLSAPLPPASVSASLPLLSAPLPPSSVSASLPLLSAPLPPASVSASLPLLSAPLPPSVSASLPLLSAPLPPASVSASLPFLAAPLTPASVSASLPLLSAPLPPASVSPSLPLLSSPSSVSASLPLLAAPVSGQLTSFAAPLPISSANQNPLSASLTAPHPSVEAPSALPVLSSSVGAPIPTTTPLPVLSAPNPATLLAASVLESSSKQPLLLSPDSAPVPLLDPSEALTPHVLNTSLQLPSMASAPVPLLAATSAKLSVPLLSVTSSSTSVPLLTASTATQVPSVPLTPPVLTTPGVTNHPASVRSTAAVASLMFTTSVTSVTNSSSPLLSTSCPLPSMLPKPSAPLLTVQVKAPTLLPSGLVEATMPMAVVPSEVPVSCTLSESSAPLLPSAALEPTMVSTLVASVPTPGSSQPVIPSVQIKVPAPQPSLPASTVSPSMPASAPAPLPSLPASTPIPLPLLPASTPTPVSTLPASSPDPSSLLLVSTPAQAPDLSSTIVAPPVDHAPVSLLPPSGVSPLMISVSAPLSRTASSPSLVLSAPSHLPVLPSQPVAPSCPVDAQVPKSAPSTLASHSSTSASPVPVSLSNVPDTASTAPNNQESKNLPESSLSLSVAGPPAVSVTLSTSPETEIMLEGDESRVSTSAAVNTTIRPRRLLPPLPRSPFYLEPLEERRKKQKVERLERIFHLNERRCSLSPVYGTEILSVCTLPQSLFGVHSTHLQTHALASCIFTPKQRLEQLRQVIERFIIAMPPVEAPQISLHTSHPPPSMLLQESLFREALSRELTPHTHCLHRIISNMRTQFPDLRLIQYDCGKLQTLDRLLRELKYGGHRVLLFTQMTRMLDVLEQFLNYHGHIYLRLDGSTRVEQRQVLMERFNMDKRIFCFILSTRSGGVGVNLTGADTVIFYDSDWNPTMDAQAQDRCHRIGQTRDVHIYRLVSERTVEENILKKAQQKRMLGDMAIEGGNFTTAYFKQHTIRELFDMEDTPRKEVDTRAVSPAHSTEEGAALKQSHILEQALGRAEDEEDTLAASLVRAEQVADLAEFNENVPLEPEEEEQNRVEQEISALVEQLTPIERYAMYFLEASLEEVSREELKQAEEQVEAARKDLILAKDEVGQNIEEKWEEEMKKNRKVRTPTPARSLGERVGVRMSERLRGNKAAEPTEIAESIAVTDDSLSGTEVQCNMSAQTLEVHPITNDEDEGRDEETACNAAVASESNMSPVVPPTEEYSTESVEHKAEDATPAQEESVHVPSVELTPGSRKTCVNIPGSPETHLNIPGSPETRLNILGSPETHLNILGSPETHLNITGSPRTRLNIPGSPETRMNIPGSPETHLNISGSPETHVNISGSPETCLNISGSPGTRLTIPGSPKTCLNIPGSPETRLNIPGSPETRLNIPGSPETRLNIPGSPETRLNIPGSPEARVTVPGSPEPHLNVPGSPEAHVTIPGSPVTSPNKEPTPPRTPRRKITADCEILLAGASDNSPTSKVLRRLPGRLVTVVQDRIPAARRYVRGKGQQGTSDNGAPGLNLAECQSPPPAVLSEDNSETTSPPPKRKRGRPPKISADLSPPPVPIKPLHSEGENSSSEKRKRGRPPKRRESSPATSPASPTSPVALTFGASPSRICALPTSPLSAMPLTSVLRDSGRNRSKSDTTEAIYFSDNKSQSNPLPSALSDPTAKRTIPVVSSNIPLVCGEATSSSGDAGAPVTPSKRRRGRPPRSQTVPKTNSTTPSHNYKLESSPDRSPSPQANTRACRRKAVKETPSDLKEQTSSPADTDDSSDDEVIIRTPLTRSGRTRLGTNETPLVVSKSSGENLKPQRGRSPRVIPGPDKSATKKRKPPSVSSPSPPSSSPHGSSSGKQKGSRRKRHCSPPERVLRSSLTANPASNTRSSRTQLLYFPSSNRGRKAKT